MFRKLAVFLAAVLCVSCMFAGFAMAAESAEAEGESGNAEGLNALIASLGESMGEAGEGESADAEAMNAESAADESADAESTGEEGDSSVGMTALLALFGYDFDAEAFYSDLDERMEAGEVLTVEDVIPVEFFDFFNSMFVPSEDSEEEAPFEIDMGADENEMYFVWEFSDELSEEECDEIVASVAGSFESEDSLAGYKNAMESLSDTYGIDIDDILFSIEFVKGDGTVMYEQAYSYEDLLELVPEEEVLDDAEAEALLEEAAAE